MPVASPRNLAQVGERKKNHTAHCPPCAHIGSQNRVSALLDPPLILDIRKTWRSLHWIHAAGLIRQKGKMRTSEQTSISHISFLIPELPASPKFLMQTPFTKPLCIFMQFRRRCNSRSLIFPSWKKVAVDYVQFAPNRR